MQNQMLSSRQAIAIIITFLFGNSVVMGLSSKVEQDSWMVAILGMVFVIPIIFIYSRIIKLSPEKDLFEIIEEVFGKYIGKIFTIIMTWYCIHLGALVMRSFSEFIKISSLQETPQLPLMIGMALVTAYIAKSGIGTFGKWSVVILPIILLVVIFSAVLLSDEYDLQKFLPMFEHPMGKIAFESLKVASFPYAETVVFLTIAGSVKKSDNIYKIYYIAMIFGMMIFLVVMLRNISSLGRYMLQATYFPSYVAARIIHVGDFFSRIESSITINFIFAGICKITLCLFGASKGIASLFGIKQYEKIIIPTGLCITALSAIIFKDILEMFNFISIYYIYAIPFQVITPSFIWIFSEIKVRKKRLEKQANA